MKSIVKYGLLTYASPEDIKNINGKLVYIVPESVKDIDNNAFIAFREQKNIVTNETIKPLILDRIILNDKIIVIKDKTFINVRAKSIKLSNKLRYIGEYAFANSFLENIILPEDLTHLGDYAFISCYNLKNVTLPSSIKKLSPRTFKNCISLKQITLPENLYYIGESCFYNSGLTKVDIPNSIKRIDSFAFSSCLELKEVKLSNSISRLEDFIFKDCIKLDNVVLPDSITNLGSACFQNCTNLKNITLTNKIKFYNTSCFQNCTSLKEITLQNKSFMPSLIDNKILACCKNLEKVTFIGEFKIKPDALEFCRNLKFLHIDNTDYDFSAFCNIKLYLDNLENIKKLTNISKTVKPYTKIEYGFATLICESRKEEHFKNAYFKFYNRLRNKFVDTDDITENIINFEKLCYNIGLFEQDKNIANKAYTFLDDILSQNLLEIKECLNYFENMTLAGYKKEFTDFFTKKENFKKLVELENQGLRIISPIYNDFDLLQENNLSKNSHHRRLAPTVERFKEMLTSEKFKGVNANNILIAEELGKFVDRQSYFDQALIIREELLQMEKETGYQDSALLENPFENIETLEKEIIRTTIDSTKTLGVIIDNNFTYEWLSKHDPKNFMLGYYCSCCAHLGGVGDGIMRASIILPNVKNLVVKDEKNRIVAKATLYINQKKGYGVFNTVQVSEEVNEKNKEKIYEKFLKGTYAFIDNYNKTNKIPLKKVNVGLNLNGLATQIFRDFKRSDILEVIDFAMYGIEHNYSGDWQDTQYTLYNQNEEYKKEPLDIVEDYYE